MRLFIPWVLLGNICFFSSCVPAPKKAKLHLVEIKDMKFVPANLQVQKGDTVRWINRDILAHDVTEEGKQGWTSSVIPSEGTWQMEVTAGFHYYCSIHLVMKGQIQVE